MVTYIYFVKCPNCEDEPFDFFDEARGYAMGCLSQKPVITQTEVCRNDFGECTDSADLGQVWSWEDEYIYIQHIFLNHSFIDGPLGYFQVLTLINKVVMNINTKSVCLNMYMHINFSQ